jgi:hypothetical protein
VALLNGLPESPTGQRPISGVSSETQIRSGFRRVRLDTSSQPTPARRGWSSSPARRFSPGSGRALYLRISLEGDYYRVMQPDTSHELIIPLTVADEPTGRFRLLPSANGHRVIFVRDKGLDNQPIHLDRLSLADLRGLREAIDAYLSR